MYNQVFICSTHEGGCGHVGSIEDWDIIEANQAWELEVLLCCICRADHCFQLTTENFNRLVDQHNRGLAQRLFYAR